MKAGTSRSTRDVESMEFFIGGLLRYGVIVAAAVIAVGMVWTFLQNGSYVRSAQALTPLVHEPHVPSSLDAVWNGVRQGEGQAVVMLGLLLLIALPVVRVALSFLLFARQRDRTFLAITGWVLGALLLSFVLGKTIG